MNNEVFGLRKLWETVEILNLLQQKKELFKIRTKLSYYKVFREYLLAIEMKKTQIIENKPVYLRLLKLELSEILMYEFWYDYVKPKYVEKQKLCNMDTDNFIVYIKQVIFIKALQKMLKLDLKLQIMN